jgi:hypothetical protein
MKRRTPREVQLADTLQAIWEAASGALADVQASHACYVHLTDTLRGIADDAAEALADLPACYSIDDEV